MSHFKIKEKDKKGNLSFIIQITQDEEQAETMPVSLSKEELEEQITEELAHQVKRMRGSWEGPPVTIKAYYLPNINLTELEDE